jgi:hypothetical protein
MQIRDKLYIDGRAAATPAGGRAAFSQKIRAERHD